MPSAETDGGFYSWDFPTIQHIVSKNITLHLRSDISLKYTLSTTRFNGSFTDFIPYPYKLSPIPLQTKIKANSNVYSHDYEHMKGVILECSPNR